MYLDNRPRPLSALAASKAGEVQAGTVLTYTATGAAAGMVAGPYGAAAGAVLGAAWGVAQGLMGASKSWRGFAARLAKTVQADTAAIQQLAATVQSATVIATIEAAVRRYNAAVGHGRADPGGLTLLVPPGATGSAHEGGLVIDFGPTVDKLRQGIELKIKELESKATAAAVTAKPIRTAGLFPAAPWWVWVAGASVAGVLGWAASVPAPRPRRR